MASKVFKRSFETFPERDAWFPTEQGASLGYVGATAGGVILGQGFES